MAGGHGYEALNAEGQSYPDPDRERPVARGQHKCGHERLVGELDGEDQAKAQQDQMPVHRSPVRVDCDQTGQV